MDEDVPEEEADEPVDEAPEAEADADDEGEEDAEPEAEAEAEDAGDDGDEGDEPEAEAEADDADDEGEDDDRPRRRRDAPSGERRRPPRTSPARIIAAARRQVEELTGRPVTGVIGFDRSDGGWDVRVEVLELKRVPETMSILGLVQVELDEEGELIGYRRVRRYAASQVDEG